MNIIQRQLGHTDLGTTSTYLQGIDPSEIIDTVRWVEPGKNHRRSVSRNSMLELCIYR